MQHTVSSPSNRLPSRMLQRQQVLQHGHQPPRSCRPQSSVRDENGDRTPHGSSVPGRAARMAEAPLVDPPHVLWAAEVVGVMAAPSGLGANSPHPLAGCCRAVFLVVCGVRVRHVPPSTVRALALPFRSRLHPPALLSGRAWMLEAGPGKPERAHGMAVPRGPCGSRSLHLNERAAVAARIESASVHRGRSTSPTTEHMARSPVGSA